MKKKFTIGIRNSLVAGNVLELYFLDGIYDYIDWAEFTMVNLVEDVINKVNAARPSKIVCYINSEGGACDIGLAIYSFLKYQPIEVETRTLALAGSIASVLQQAASPGKRYIARSAQMVIHQAWGYGMGTSNELRTAADVVDRYTAIIVDIYAEVSGRAAAEIQALIQNGDYWMSGEEAVAMGLADALFDDIPQGFELMNSIRDLDDHYTNTPEALKKLIPPAPPAQNTVPIMKTIKERIAAFSASLKTKKVKQGATSDEMPAEIANAIGEPLEEMLSEMHDDYTAQLNEQVESITNSVRTAITAELQAATTTVAEHTTTIAELNATIETMRTELADRSGGESGGAPTNGIKPIGRFNAGAATAE